MRDGHGMQCMRDIDVWGRRAASHANDTIVSQTLPNMNNGLITLQ